MKVNEAPKKIYISNFGIEALSKNEQLSGRWHEVSTQDTDIEYTHTDAFIEKACDAFCSVCDTKECEGCAECIWIINFRKQLMKLL